MLTQLVTTVLQHMASVPALLCYVIVAVWIGLDNAGIPMPLEPMLLFAGALATTGHTNLVWTVASAMIGALVFATAAYYLGQRYGKPAVTRAGRRMGLTPARADHIELWLEQRSALGVLIAAVCPILRTFSAYIMGVVSLPLRRFVLGTLLAALAYTGLWILLGWALGATYRAPLRSFDSIGFLGFLILAVLVALAVALHHYWGRLALRHVAHHFHYHQVDEAQAEAAAIAYLDATLAARGGLRAYIPAARSAPAQAVASIAQPIPDHAPASGDLPMERMWASIQRAAIDLWAEVTARSRSTQKRQAARAVVLGEGWPNWVGAVITFALSEMALVLLMLAVAAHFLPAFPLDAGLEAQIQRLNGTFLAQPIKLAGDLQWYQPAAVSYVLIYGMLLVLRQFRAMICTAVATFGADLFNLVVNTFVARPRPHGVQIPTLSGNLGQGSFPSGHVAHTVGLYGFVFFLCVLTIRVAPRWKPVLVAVQAICAYFIVCVGLSRIMEGAHWPSDVLGGYLSGSLVLVLAVVLYHLLAMRAARVKPALLVQPAFAAAG